MLRQGSSQRDQYLENKKKGRISRKSSLQMTRQSSQRLLSSTSFRNEKISLGGAQMMIAIADENFSSELEREIVKNKETSVLEEENRTLREEKIELIKTHEKESKLRDEDLQIIQTDIDERIGKIEKQNKDLRTKLDKAQKKAAKADELQKTIEDLKEELEQSGGYRVSSEFHGENLAREQKIIELEEELEAARKIIEFEKTDEYVERLKQEVKVCKEEKRELKKQIRSEKQKSLKRARKKDETVEFLQKEMMKMRKDVDFKLTQQRKQQSVAMNSLDDVGAQYVQDLEDEVGHWKGANIELEEDLVRIRSEVSEWKEKAKSAGYRDENEDDDSADGDSVYTFKSRLTQITKQFTGEISPKASDDNENLDGSLGAGLAGLWNKFGSGS